MTFVTANSQLRIPAIWEAWAEPRVTKVIFGRTAFTDTCTRTRNGGEVEENMGRVSGKTVRDLASTNPSAARTFESFGIDYCCGGERSLAQACSAAKVSVEEVMRALEQTPAKGDDRDWQAASLRELVKHIIEKHHAYVRAEIPRLIALLAKVVRPPAKPCGTRKDRVVIRGPSGGTNPASPERGTYALPIHRATRRCGEERTPPGAGHVRDGAESGAHDGDGTRFRRRTAAQDARGHEWLHRPRGRVHELQTAVSSSSSGI